jgi:hypothetical protein
MSLWKERIRYHYKKYVAIVTAVIATALMISSFAVSLVSQIKTGSSSDGISLTAFWNFAVFSVIYITILMGNIQGSYSAYNGVLGYIFMFTFNAILQTFFSSVDGISVWFTGSVGMILFFLFYFSFIAGSALTGVMTYIRIRQFLGGRYSSYKGVRNWSLFFMIASILVSGLSPLLLFLESRSVDVLLYVLLPLSEVFISVSIYFTVLRLKSDY